jgi:hypothetical protein
MMLCTLCVQLELSDEVVGISNVSIEISRGVDFSCVFESNSGLSGHSIVFVGGGW